MENLRRWREPVAVALLIASGVRLLAGIVAVPVLASTQAYGSFAVSALFGAAGVADTVLLLAAAASAAACLFAPPTPHGRTIAAVAVIETVAAVLVSLVFGLMGLTADAVGRGVEVVQLLAALVLPSVAVVLLLGLLRGVPVAVSAPIPASDPAAVPPAIDTAVDDRNLRNRLRRRCRPAGSPNRPPVWSGRPRGKPPPVPRRATGRRLLERSAGSPFRAPRTFRPRIGPHSRRRLDFRVLTGM